MTLPGDIPSSTRRKLRVAIADDSAVVRGMISQWLEHSHGVEVCGFATDGEQALKLVAREAPDLLILDDDMPILNGRKALPRLMAIKPDLRVIMALSDQTSSVEARNLPGVEEVISKPPADHLGGAEAFRQELLHKINGSSAAFGAQKRDAPPAPSTNGGAPRAVTDGVLVVAASTGGPQAVHTLLAALGPDWRTPVLIVQHMPASFTKVLAAQLSKAGGPRVREATHGAPLAPGMAYVAPGDQHMRLGASAGGALLLLDQEPEENWCRPSADPLIRSAINVFGKSVVAVILTGMGKDGLGGCRDLIRAGGLVLAQDEASSVVWGMPGAVVSEGLADSVAPIPFLARRAAELLEGRRA